jgi:SPP1 gp7 family putative phage head morphogenesis protein
VSRILAYANEEGLPTRVLGYADESGQVLVVYDESRAAPEPEPEPQVEREFGLGQVVEQLDAIESMSKDQLREVFVEMRDALTSTVKKASDAGHVNEKWIIDLKLRRRAELQLAVQEALRRAFAGGQAAARLELGTVKGTAEFAYDPKQPRHPKGSAQGGQWSDEGYTGAAPKGGFKASVPEFLIDPRKPLIVMDGKKDKDGTRHGHMDHRALFGFKFEDQARQYPAKGREGIGYFKGDVGGGKYVDALLMRKGGKIVGILNHYPFDFLPNERKGNVNVMVDPAHQRQGIGSALLLEAGKRWNVDLGKQNFTPSGAALANALARKRLKVDTRKKKFALDDTADFANVFAPRSALRWLNARALQISGVLSDRLLTDAKGILIQALKTGELMSDTMVRLNEIFLPLLGEQVDESVTSPWRLENIVRTNTTEAYNHGRLTEYINPAIVGFVRGVRFQAILDQRTTEVCRFLDGKVFRPDSPDLPGLLPPRHFQCRSIITPIVAGMALAPEEFITAEQVARARELSDQKFLEETQEPQPFDYNPAQPRHEKGSPLGGQWRDAHRDEAERVLAEAGVQLVNANDVEKPIRDSIGVIGQPDMTESQLEAMKDMAPVFKELREKYGLPEIKMIIGEAPESAGTMATVTSPRMTVGYMFYNQGDDSNDNYGRTLLGRKNFGYADSRYRDTYYKTKSLREAFREYNRTVATHELGHYLDWHNRERATVAFAEAAQSNLSHETLPFNRWMKSNLSTYALMGGPMEAQAEAFARKQIEGKLPPELKGYDKFIDGIQRVRGNKTSKPKSTNWEGERQYGI